MDADSTRSGAFIKVNGNSLHDLLLQIAEVLALGGDAARSIRVVPPCHQAARLRVTLDLKCDFFHYLVTIIPYRRWSGLAPAALAHSVQHAAVRPPQHYLHR